MTLLQSIFMGLIQGLTEFLPVSSSGHLALFKILFHVNTDGGILFDVLLHIGTLAAVCLIYYKDIIRLIVEFIRMMIDVFRNLALFLGKRRNPNVKYYRIISNPYRKFVLLIIVSTVPTACIGYACRDLVEAVSSILLIPGICLLVTSFLLFITDRLPAGRKGPKKATFTNAVVIGIFQGIATMPGISRSGSTIAASVLCGFDRRFAVKYSFILSIPSILGALVMELQDIRSVEFTSGLLINYIAGMIVAAVVGYFAIKLMLSIVQNKKLIYFSIYCLAIGVVSIIGYIAM